MTLPRSYGGAQLFATLPTSAMAMAIDQDTVTGHAPEKDGMMKTRTPARSGPRDSRDVGLRLLRRILREALRAVSIRAEIDGERSEHLEQLVDDLRLHIERVERGDAHPDPTDFGNWLDRVRSVPAGAPSRWRRAARLSKVPLRPLASMARAGARSEKPDGRGKVPGEVA